MGKHRKKINVSISHSQLLEDTLREKQKNEKLQEDWTNWQLSAPILKVFKSKNITNRKNTFISNVEIAFDIRITNSNDVTFYNKDNMFNLNNKKNPQLPFITGIKYTFTMENPTAVFCLKKTLFTNQDKNDENLQDENNIFNNPLQGGTGKILTILNAKSTYDTFYPQYNVVIYGSNLSTLQTNNFEKKTISNFIIFHQNTLLYPLQNKETYSEASKFCDINIEKKTNDSNKNYYNEVLFCGEKNDSSYFFNGGINHILKIIETDKSNNYKVTNNDVFILNNKIEYDDNNISKLIMKTNNEKVQKGTHIKIPESYKSSILNTSNNNRFIPPFVRVTTNNGYINIKTNNWANFLNYYSTANGTVTTKALSMKLEYPRTKDDTSSQIFKLPFNNSISYRTKQGILLSPEYPRPPQDFSYILMGRFTKKITHWFWLNGKPSEILLVEPTIPYIGSKLHYIDENGIEHSNEYVDPSKYPNRFKKQIKKNILISPEMDKFSYRWNDSWIGTDDFTTFNISRTIQTTNKYNWETPGFQYRMIMGFNSSYDENIFGLDEYGGKIHADGTYRIHSPALFLEKNDDGTYKYADCIIGYTFDGYPIMGVGSKNYPTQSTDYEVTATSSYRLKTKAERNAETNYYGSHQQYAYGLYVSDWIYEEDYGNLDSFNGGYAIIDDFERVLFMTPTYPYFPPFINNSITYLQTST